MDSTKLGAEHNKNVGRHLRLLKMMMELGLPEELQKRETLRDAVSWIQSFPSFGPFLAYQSVVPFASARTVK